MTVSDDIAIKLQPSAEEIAQLVCLHNDSGMCSTGSDIPIDQLATLAIAYHKRGDKLLEIRDRVKASIGIQRVIVAEISRLME